MLASPLVSPVHAPGELAGLLPYVLAGFMLLALLMVVVGGIRAVRAARSSGQASDFVMPGAEPHLREPGRGPREPSPAGGKPDPTRSDGSPGRSGGD